MAKIIIEIEDTLDNDFQVHLFTNTEQHVSDALLDLDKALLLSDRTKAITIAAVGLAAIRKFVMESHEFSKGQAYGEMKYGEDTDSSDTLQNDLNHQAVS